MHALAGSERALYAATDRGLVVGRAYREPGAPIAAETSREPDIAEVHRAAVRHLSLGAARLERWRDALSRRGWLPVLSLSAGVDRIASRAEDWDESFVSGATRRLFDRDRDRRSAWEAELTLSWDLGDVLYHPEEIDLSRESRALIQLRDDVLDEITRLFYERRRVLAELAALEDSDASEALRLRLRADELAAGIDAWTGGWFGRRAARRAP